MFTLLFLINLYRVQPLVETHMLDSRAQVRAEYLCSHTFSHKGWGASFEDLSGYVGENLAKGYSSNQETVVAWMQSPDHEKNIVDKNYKTTGFGQACGVTVELFN